MVLSRYLILRNSKTKKIVVKGQTLIADGQKVMVREEE